MTNHFIRGYFDGDGCISLPNNIKHRPLPQFRMSFVSGSLKFLEWIRLQLRENLIKIGNPNIIKRKNEDKKDKNCWVLSFGGNKQVQIIMNWLYNDCKNNYLGRKYIKYNKSIEIIHGGIQ